MNVFSFLHIEVAKLAKTLSCKGGGDFDDEFPSTTGGGDVVGDSGNGNRYSAGSDSYKIQLGPNAGGANAGAASSSSIPKLEIRATIQSSISEYTVTESVTPT
jgi:hypothetical protein